MEKANFPVAQTGVHEISGRSSSIDTRPAGRCYYDSPRVLRELRAQGIRIGRQRVIRLMRLLGLVTRRRRLGGTPSNDRHLAIRPLENAIKRRCPGEGLLHHSDRGAPYTSEEYQRVLSARDIESSMSRKGNCIDNEAIESWFSTLKAELCERFESFGQAKEELFDYIEVLYDQKRRHSSLDYVSPAEYERETRDTGSQAA